MKPTRTQLAAVRRKVHEHMDRTGLRCEIGQRYDGDVLTTNAARWPEEEDLVELKRLHLATDEDFDAIHVLDVYVYGRPPGCREAELLTNVYVILRDGTVEATAEEWEAVEAMLQRMADVEATGGAR